MIQPFFQWVTTIGIGCSTVFTNTCCQVCHGLVSSIIKFYRWGANTIVGRVGVKILFFLGKAVVLPFKILWGKNHHRFLLIRRWVIAPCFAIALITSSIITVQAAVPLFIAYQIGASLFTGIAASAIVAAGERAYDAKMIEVNSHLAWSSIAAGAGAQSERRTCSVGLVRFDSGPVEDNISTAWGYRGAFDRNVQITRTGPHENLYCNPLHINLKGTMTQYFTKNTAGDLIYPFRGYLHGPVVGYGGATKQELATAALDRIAQPLAMGTLVHDPDRLAFVQAKTWRMDDQFSLSSEFQLLKNNIGVPPNAENILSKPLNTPEYPCVLQYEIVEVGYGVWEDRNNDGVDEWYEEIDYGDHVEYVKDCVMMESFQDHSRTYMPTVPVGDSQGIARISFTGNATRSVIKATEYKCKFMNMGDDGYVEIAFWPDRLACYDQSIFLSGGNHVEHNCGGIRSAYDPMRSVGWKRNKIRTVSVIKQDNSYPYTKDGSVLDEDE